MGYLVCMLFTCLAFYTIRISEAFINVQQTTCKFPTCATCPYGWSHNYRYDGRGCQECYCERYSTTMMPSSTSGCPYATCPDCDSYHYLNHRTDWRGCQECYCELRTTWPPVNAFTTDSSLNLHPASYWSMSRSSLLSILLNLKQEAQSLLDTAKDTYDHVLHSVIVNDLKKRREAVKEDETKDQADNKQA